MILLHDVRQLENFIWGSETTKSMVKSIIRGGGVVYYDIKQRAIRFDKTSPPLCYTRPLKKIKEENYEQNYKNTK